MLKYITDTEYKELLGTNSIPSNFNKLVIEASAYINHHTSNRIDVNDIHENVKYVTALIIEKINKAETKIEEIGNLKSQNIEGWSETYSTPEEIRKDLEVEKLDLLHQYLWNVIGSDGQPLLYCGVLWWIKGFLYTLLQFIILTMMKHSREWFLRLFILDTIKSLIWLINGLEKGSSGTIYIPTTQELEIGNDDIVVVGTPVLSVKDFNEKTVKYVDNVSIKKLSTINDDVNSEFVEIYQDNTIQKYRVVSVEDNRKGNLQHYKLGVSE